MCAGARAKEGSAQWKVCQRDTDPGLSLYPLFEVHSAGLKEVVKCMLDLRVGFHAGEIHETQFRVIKAQRLEQWDAVAMIIHNVCVVACLCVVAGMVFFNQVNGNFLFVLLVFCGFYFFSFPTLKIWILRIPPPEGTGAISFFRRAYWLTCKYFIFIYIAIMLYLGPPLVRMKACYYQTTCCHRDASTVAGLNNTTVLCADPKPGSYKQFDQCPL